MKVKEALNFVFLFADEMSASSLHCYGNKYVKTPNMDRIAQEGTKFDQCYVQNPVCSPSRCSLMTGTYVHNRGHRTLWYLLQPDEPSLFRYLKNQGYDISWYGKMTYIVMLMSMKSVRMRKKKGLGMRICLPKIGRE